MAIEDYMKRVEDWNQKVRELRRSEPVIPEIISTGNDRQDYMFQINHSFEQVSMFVKNGELWEIVTGIPFRHFIKFIGMNALFSDENKLQIVNWYTNIH